MSSAALLMADSQYGILALPPCMLDAVRQKPEKHRRGTPPTAFGSSPTPSQSPTAVVVVPLSWRTATGAPAPQWSMFRTVV